MRLQIFADLSKDLNIVSLFITIKTEAATGRCSVKKGVLKHFAKFTTLLKDTLAQVFSSEYGKSLKNTFFTEHLRETASVKKQQTF